MFPNWLRSDVHNSKFQDEAQNLLRNKGGRGRKIRSKCALLCISRKSTQSCHNSLTVTLIAILRIRSWPRYISTQKLNKLFIFFCLHFFGKTSPAEQFKKKKEMDPFKRPATPPAKTAPAAAAEDAEGKKRLWESTTAQLRSCAERDSFQRLHIRLVVRGLKERIGQLEAENSRLRRRLQRRAPLPPPGGHALTPFSSSSSSSSSFSPIAARPAGRRRQVVQMTPCATTTAAAAGAGVGAGADVDTTTKRVDDGDATMLYPVESTPKVAEGGGGGARGGRGLRGRGRREERGGGDLPESLS